jgi:hypothetical protein
MKAVAILLISHFLTTACSAFAASTSFKDQVNRADTILRIVVVSATTIEEDTSFTAIAKCRVITKIKGGDSLGDFIFIPCAYNIDPDQSPIDLEGDYVVMLNTLKGVEIGHPVTFDSVYPISEGKIKFADSIPVRSLSFEEFQALIKATSGKNNPKANTEKTTPQPEPKAEPKSESKDQ